MMEICRMRVGMGNSESRSFWKEFVHFFRYHSDQVKQGGWSVMLRKFRTFLGLVPFMPLTIPVVLIVRALRPVVLIRFGPLRSERIGHLAANTESYLCRCDAGLDNQRAFDIFYHRAPACNRQLKKMWDRTLHVCRLVGPLDKFNRNLPGGGNHIILWPEWGDRDIEGLLPRTPVHLSFTPEEEQLGHNGLRAMGVPEGAPFICFHSRDAEYLKAAFPNVHSRGHDYRDSNIRHHVSAAEEMTRRGYYAFRMGAVVKEVLQTTNPMVIDYATNYRSDFMDIYLCAKCYFYIGDDCGLNRVATIFRRPMATVNQIPIDLIHTQGKNDLFILKKLWSPAENRFLKLREIIKMGAGSYTRTVQYEQAVIEPVENTPEEICGLAVEMDERLKGTWQAAEEDEELQRRFWSIFKLSAKELHGIIESRIGADFLRRNRELLE